MGTISKPAVSYFIGFRIFVLSTFLWSTGCAESLLRTQGGSRSATTPLVSYRAGPLPALLGPFKIYSGLDIQSVYQAAMSIRWNYPQWTRIENCYQRRLSHQPSLEGEIDLRVVIDETGAVTQATIVRDSTEDSMLQACIVRKIETTWLFPKPHGGLGDIVLTLKFEPVRGRTPGEDD